MWLGSVMRRRETIYNTEVNNPKPCIPALHILSLNPEGGSVWLHRLTVVICK